MTTAVHPETPVAGGERIHPRQVFCPIEDVYRDRQVADDATAGRFRYAGVTLDLGLPPDWLGDGLADDEEWHIEWTKFYFGLDLAHAYSVTGDAAYVDAWQSLVLAWIEQCPTDVDSSDVTARRLQNWLYAWQGFDRVPGFPGLDAEVQERLITSMAAQLDHVTATLTPERNHRTLELYGLLVVSLGLPVLDPDGSRATRAWAALQDNLLTDVWADGVHRERSTHYHLIALRSFLAARVNVTRFDGDVPAAYDDRLRAACRFAMHLHRPDGQIPALSDSDSGSYLDLLRLAADTLADRELRYVATGGVEGTPPVERHAGFPVGGYHVQRSGWGDGTDTYADERFLIFGCGPLGDGGHGHYDALSVEAYAHGRPLVVDPGRYTYAEGTPNWRHWFKGTAAHNTVTVDGLDQQPYRRGKPKGEQLRSRLLSECRTAGLHVLHGEVTSPAYDAVHRRAVVLVAGEYWLVLDHLRAPGPHDYVVRWHLAEDTVPTLTVPTPTVPTPTVPTPTVPTVTHGAGGRSRVTTDAVTLELSGGGPAVVEPGWVARDYGVKTPAPVVTMTASGSGDADLVTLLAPGPSVASRHLWQADPATGVIVVQSADGTTDEVRWRDGWRLTRTLGTPR